MSKRCELCGEKEETKFTYDKGFQEYFNLCNKCKIKTGEEE